ncbi:unnamed protein product [Paramecium pentaurelia]|uniref:Uncharacterized protein n=1 Tax=Paramecium pentaurelia TaxID=43138 RepID=A0A8S1Y419_9CILI|nr:unnamed protein product [Paramecium pentaurelia]
MKNKQYQIRVTLDSTPSTYQTNETLSLWENLQRSKDSPRKSKIRIVRDPLENECPLQQPNPFLFNEQLKHSFRDYLEGQKTALNLVNECNHIISQSHKMDQLKLFTNVNKFRSQLKQRSSVRLSMNQNNSQSEDLLQRKIKIQERFHKIKTLIQQRMQAKNKKESLRDVQLFKHLFETCEKNVNKIKSKNLLSEKADGIREYDKIKYSKNPQGSLRVRLDNDSNQNKCNNLRSKTLPDQQTIHLTRKKEREKMNLKLTEFLEHDQNQEKNLLLKAKRNLIRELKNGNQKFHQFEPNRYNITDPLSKDVKFYAYMFMKPKNDDILQKKNQKYKMLCKTERIQQNNQRHYLANFNKLQSNSRDESLEEDSSFNSMLEINIDNLYKRSTDLQNMILNTKSEKFVKRIRQFQKVQSLTTQIIKVNEQKLSNTKLL